MATKPKQGITVVATGVLGSDPKSAGKYTVARFAVSQPGKKVNDEWENRPSMWFDIMAAGEQLEGGSKGQYVTVEGRLSMGTYQDKPTFTIWAEKVTEAKVEGEKDTPKSSDQARAEASNAEPALTFPE